MSGQCAQAHLVSGQCVKCGMGVVSVLRVIWKWSVHKYDNILACK